MAMKNPGDVARKWQGAMARSADAIKAGVQAVTTNPAEKAIAAKDRYVEGVQRAVNSGKYERGLRRTSLSQWQNAMTEKGLQRIASGAAQAVPKMEAFLAKWLPYQESLKSKLANMPRGSLEQNIERARMAILHNADFKYQ